MSKRMSVVQLIDGGADIEMNLTTNNARFGPATFQRKSCNAKLSTVKRKRHANGRYQTFPQAPFISSTYVSIDATCPNSCRFKNNGCYVQAGQAANTMKRLDIAGASMSGEDVNLLEAELIDSQWNSNYHGGQRVPQDGGRHGDRGRDLRLHVGGDFYNARGAEALGDSLELYKLRGGGDGWSYTHRWRAIPADSYGPSLNVLASCETLREVEEAIDIGYMPSITVIAFKQDRAYSIPGNPVKIVPCPAQTRHVKCVDCRMCFKPMPKGTAIAFALHGMGKSKAARRLSILGQTTLALE